MPKAQPVTPGVGATVVRLWWVVVLAALIGGAVAYAAADRSTTDRIYGVVNMRPVATLANDRVDLVEDLDAALTLPSVLSGPAEEADLSVSTLRQDLSVQPVGADQLRPGRRRRARRRRGRRRRGAPRSGRIRVDVHVGRELGRGRRRLARDPAPVRDAARGRHRGGSGGRAGGVARPRRRSRPSASRPRSTAERSRSGSPPGGGRGRAPGRPATDDAGDGRVLRRLGHPGPQGGCRCRRRRPDRGRSHRSLQCPRPTSSGSRVAPALSC